MLKITIAITVYNKEKYIRECFESLINQSDNCFNTVVIDDGSTDASKNLCDSFAASFHSVLVKHYSNAGLLQARRRALNCIDNGYIVFLDADDYLRDDAVHVLKQAIKQSNASDIIAFDMIQTHNSNDLKRHCGSRRQTNSNLEIWDIQKAREWLLTGNSNNLCGKAIKRSCFDSSLDYSEYGRLMHGEDLLQSLETFDRAQSFSRLYEPIYYYRRGNDNSTSNYSHSQLLDIEQVIEQVNKCGTKWTGNTERSAIGALIQYCSLFSLLEESPNLENNQKVIERHLIEVGILSIYEKNPRAIQELKPHLQLVVKLICCGKHDLASFVIRKTAKLKTVLSQYGLY